MLGRPSAEADDDLLNFFLAQPVAQPPDLRLPTFRRTAKRLSAWSATELGSVMSFCKAFLQVRAVRVTPDKLHKLVTSSNASGCASCANRWQRASAAGVPVIAGGKRHVG